LSRRRRRPRERRLVGRGPRGGLQRRERLRDGEIDAPAEIDRLGAPVEGLGAALHQRVGEHDRRGRPVAGDRVPQLFRKDLMFRLNAART